MLIAIKLFSFPPQRNRNNLVWCKWYLRWFWLCSLRDISIERERQRKKILRNRERNKNTKIHTKIYTTSLRQIFLRQALHQKNSVCLALALNKFCVFRVTRANLQQCSDLTIFKCLFFIHCDFHIIAIKTRL